MRQFYLAIILGMCLINIAAPALQTRQCNVCQEKNQNCFVDDVGAVYCKGVMVSYPAELENPSYVVDSRATQIGFGAFSENDYLVNVTIPNGVTIIQEYAFEGCTSLATIDLPQTLLIIDEYAFALCTSLEKIELPSSLYCIGNQAFVDTWKLNSVTLPGSLRFIGNEAFANSHLNEVFVYTTNINYGFNVFTTHHLTSNNNLVIHFLEEVSTEEAGNAILWSDDLLKTPKIRVSFDLRSNEDH